MERIDFTSIAAMFFLNAKPDKDFGTYWFAFLKRFFDENFIIQLHAENVF
jgi:hypothetical protein